MLEESDVFRGLAPLLRVRPELQQICRFGAQWASEHEPEPCGWAPFHIVTFGGCLLEVGDHGAIVLKEGDVAILPHGGPHVVRALPTATGQSSTVRVHPRLHDKLVVKSNVEGEPDTKLICGRLCFEHAHTNVVLAALPAVVVLPATDGDDACRMRELVEMIRSELEDDRLGAAAIASALAGSLMMLMLRAHFKSEPRGQGTLALLARKQTARVLAGMLADTARNWTLDELAERGNTSRATLVRLFRSAVNMAPLAFLAELRLTLAKHRILASRAPLAEIAEEVGYQSETAFSRAYQRRFGNAPGADRKSRADVRAISAEKTPATTDCV